jgi:colicin import membrane protein
MSIAVNIDGSPSGGLGQFVELLTTVADSKAYAEKIKELQALIEEKKAIVELVAPANDILALREHLRKELADAKAATSKQKAEAQEKLRSAENSAIEIVATAEAKAQEIIASARVATEAADIKLRAAEEAAARASEAQKIADAAQEKAAKELAQAASLMKDAISARREADEIKASILAKHKAFIESIS